MEPISPFLLSFPDEYEMYYYNEATKKASHTVLEIFRQILPKLDAKQTLIDRLSKLEKIAKNYRLQILSTAHEFEPLVRIRLYPVLISEINQAEKEEMRSFKALVETISTDLKIPLIKSPHFEDWELSEVGSRWRKEVWEILQPELLKVTTLRLSSRNLKRVPKEIKDLKNLVVLNLSDNHLTTLPPGMIYLDSLEELNLAGNYFTSMPHEVFDLQNLRFLNLAGNEIKNLPKDLDSLENLQALNLSPTLQGGNNYGQH